MSVTFFKSYVVRLKIFNQLNKKIQINHISRNFYEKRNILKLSQRGMFEDTLPDTSSNEIVDLLHSKPQCVYAGFDPTASSLHIGNLLIVKNLIHWQRAGHRVIALIGMATAQIGDPSGRTKDREQQNIDIVRDQGRKIQNNIQTIFDNHEEYFWNRIQNASLLTPVQFLNNEDWYKEINVIDFMNKIVRHFRMGPMLLKDSVNRRISSEYGMCCTEFMYQVFQAYDWYHLYKTHHCKFQIGGKDQMGNIESGHKLIRRLLDKPSFGLTIPLVTDENGNKLGKSVQNCIWLDPLLTSPYEFYEYFLKVPHSLVARLLMLFSFSPYADIESLVNRHVKTPEKRIAQTALAEELTLLVHGESGLNTARLTAKALVFGDIESLQKLDIETMKAVIGNVIQVKCNFKLGYTVLDFVVDIGCFKEKMEAIAMINNQGLYINQKKALNPNEVITQSVHMLPNKTTIVRVGKKKCYIVEWILPTV